MIAKEKVPQAEEILVNAGIPANTAPKALRAIGLLLFGVDLYEEKSNTKAQASAPKGLGKAFALIVDNDVGEDAIGEGEDVID